MCIFDRTKRAKVICVCFFSVTASKLICRLLAFAMAGRLSTILIVTNLVSGIDVSAYRKRQANEGKSEAVMSEEASEHQKEGTFVTLDGTAQTYGTAQVSVKTYPDDPVEVTNGPISMHLGDQQSAIHVGDQKITVGFGDQGAAIRIGEKQGATRDEDQQDKDSYARTQAASFIVSGVAISSAAINIL
eukprot:TRINITY_DN6347_c0_g1_i2.p1 TRINITY_DN6347_c0_g1~~TRINITY_DN6347_c0_g1_i2.p1  ORF type:complete len:188 (-),score=26.64 TRINITY_DN6347_c0_g1_i2:148-711(-)